MKIEKQRKNISELIARKQLNEMNIKIYGYCQHFNRFKKKISSSVGVRSVELRHMVEHADIVTWPASNYHIQCYYFQTIKICFEFDLIQFDFLRLHYSEAGVHT